MLTSVTMHASRDIDRLSEIGISGEEADRQLELLRHPPAGIELVRPCTVGDGIESIPPGAVAALHERHDRAAAAGELSAFVPASGAASRMFRDLLAYRDDTRPLTRSELEHDRDTGRADAYSVLEFLEGLRRFAFRAALERVLERQGQSISELLAEGPYRPIIEAVMGSEGLDYARLPKALVPFHAYPDGVRTAFQEHLDEGAELYRDRQGRVRVNATIPTGTRPGFDAVIEAARTAHLGNGGARLDVTLSLQDPSTDTLALDADGEPFRDASGRLVLRPAGHGALIRNLAGVENPIAFIKNIDNIAARRFRQPTRDGVRTLIGRLCALRDEAPSDRPARVCGVVPNTGEPGGGPFWVRGSDGRITPQIVESAQVRLDDPEQRAIWSRATHFNPVLIACSLQDGSGRRHDLGRFVDERAVIVTRRSSEGRDLVALERPGLWNGGMAGWTTVFVEVPLAMFTPVKVVNDLLRPEHQP